MWSTISEIQLALFGILLILYTSTDWENFWVSMLYFSTKLWLIKISVALKSTSVYIDKNFDILVVSKEMDRYSEVLQVLKIVNYQESPFFHLEHWVVYRVST